MEMDGWLAEKRKGVYLTWQRRYFFLYSIFVTNKDWVHHLIGMERAGCIPFFYHWMCLARVEEVMRGDKCRIVA